MPIFWQGEIRRSQYEQHQDSTGERIERALRFSWLIVRGGFLAVLMIVCAIGFVFFCELMNAYLGR